MTFGMELESKILRLHHVEKWGVYTIARLLPIHNTVVERVLSQAGLHTTDTFNLTHQASG